MITRPAPEQVSTGRPAGATPARPEGLPALSGDLRPLIPPLGLRNYWYPAVPARRVRDKPVKVRMLGETLCFFRGRQGQVVALQDVCPHRGASLAEGHCHWPGTVACPYHGWVFDETGRNVAVLSEGPDSTVCGKRGTEAKVYPTRELKGVVFAWIGDTPPAPIEEDVPEEFFDPDALVLHGLNIWPVNWEVALENSMDSHPNYLHRDALVMLIRPTYLPRGAQGDRPLFVGNGFSGDLERASITRPQPPQDYYPQFGWRWPKHRYRQLWAPLFRPVLEQMARTQPPIRSARWAQGHRLPGMYRSAFWFGIYTRQTVPLTPHKTRLWYFFYVKPRNQRERLQMLAAYHLLHKWLIVYNFSAQDARVMLHQRYDWPEKLSSTDAEIIQWRKLVVTKHLGGRDAPFPYQNPDGLAPEAVPVERIHRIGLRYTRSAAAALEGT
jgi:phenylpropionate dioxygenase-like ring-hydroxylating dioxygenase large terminal subunit